MNYWYIGSFPPPYGGVTKKNVMVYESLKSSINIKRIRKKSKIAMIRQLFHLLNRQTGFIIGVGSMKNLEIIIMVMSKLNPGALEKTIVMVPGGTFDKYVSNASIRYKNCLKKVKVLLVETKGMKENLNEIGLNNVDVFPNCRNNTPNFIPSMNNKSMKFIFFSMISNHKGIDLFLEAAQYFPEFQFDVYGELNFPDKEKEEFLKKCKKYNNVNYFGCFKGADEEIYNLLNKYDALIFPSRWKSEGVPGVLVESKIAALPAIVSSINYNTEVVIDEKEGIVLKENNIEELVNAIKRIDEDRELLYKLAVGAKESAERYQYENYRKTLLDYLE
ncbi:TPA: glycosyltransferase [Enterococcus faecium]|uniref:glycosyltransferase n=1 Tax=Enterococcus faecium TaxID=1352 RepID=UPI0002A37FAA|nr:glycosyltransferase [Enterococcus faecium]ELB18980.1 hypothetical protein OIQ_03964 [Enterococcus faecium EnGen0025]MBO6335644.1 glycosyltransferase [Enterococcus faecium]RYJ84269.1 glycosyltransferase [Enterococcus faecium]